MLLSIPQAELPALLCVHRCFVTPGINSRVKHKGSRLCFTLLYSKRPKHLLRLLLTFKYKGIDPGSAGSFRDVPYRAYYADAVAWAVEYGITNGTAPGLFSPAQTCTRAQIVTFLYRDLAAEWEDYET